MHNHIARFLCFMLLLNVLFSKGVMVEKAFASDSQNSSDGGEILILNQDFTKVPEETEASKLGYTPLPLAQGTGTAIVELEPLSNKNALHMKVEGAGSSVFKIAKPFSENLLGYVTTEMTFMQPSKGNTTRKDDSLIILSSDTGTSTSPSVNIGLSSKYSSIVPFNNAAPVDLATLYQLDTWYTLKVVHMTYSKKANIYLNGTLIASRRDVNDANDLKVFMMATPKGDGDLYVGSVKITYKPVPVTPNTEFLPELDAPTIVNTFSRNREIGLQWEPDAAAWRYRLYVKNNLDDPLPTFVSQSYNNNPGKIPDESSVQKETASLRLMNGQKYYVGVQADYKNFKLNKDILSSKITWVEATATGEMSIPSSASNVITNFNLDGVYYGREWSVQSGLKVGDEPLSGLNYKITDLPSQYAGSDYVRPSGMGQREDPGNIADNGTTVLKGKLATFDLRDNATVYVAIDGRTTPPKWITDANSGWTDTGDTIRVTDGVQIYTLKVYKQAFAANGKVTMGTNVISDITSSKSIGYFVLAKRTPVGLKTDSIKEYVNNSKYTVSGSVYESVYNNSVTLSVYQNKALLYNNKLTQNNFKWDLNLTPGANLIEILATRGTSTLSDKITATINYDAISPEIRIPVPPSTVKDAVYTLQGSLSKAANLSIKLNGVKIADSVDKAVYEPFSYPLALSEGTNLIEVSTVDIAGNVSRVNYIINYVFWTGQAATYDLNGKQVVSITAMKDIAAQREVTNTTGVYKQVSLLFGLYDANNSLIDYSIVVADFEPGETKILNTGFTLPVQVNGYSVRAFVWDSLNGMKPLSDEFRLQ